VFFPCDFSYALYSFLDIIRDRYRVAAAIAHVVVYCFFFFPPPMLLFLSLLYVFKGIILFLLREKDGGKTKGWKKTI
jgi:hypothetical protein